MLQDTWVRSKVGEDYIFASDELQIDLWVVFVALGTSIKRPPERGPTSGPVAELYVVPDLDRVAVLSPRGCRLAHVFFHARMHLPRNHEADFQAVAQLVIRLIEESGIHFKHNRGVRSVVASDEVDKLFDHLFACSTRHSVPLAAAEDCIDDQYPSR